MAYNPNVRFGRRIGPIKIEDVQKGNIQRLYNPTSTDARSSNIVVGAEPVVLVAFGLKQDEIVTVNNAYGSIEGPTLLDGIPIQLDELHTLVVLPISGVYFLEYIGEALGDLTVIAYRMSAMHEKAASSVDITNPNGPQQNRPNLFLSGSPGILETHDFFVGSTPIVFRAYGIQEQVLELYSVYEGLEAPVVELNPVAININRTTLVIHIAGHYKFKVTGDSTGVILVENPTVLNYLSDGGGSEGGGGVPGTAVTYVGTGAGLTGGPITSAGTIALSVTTQARLGLADTAVQPGDAISVLVNDAEYITAGVPLSIFENDTGYITDENVVLKTGAQTINDTKTFLVNPIVPTPPPNDQSTKAVNTEWVANAIYEAVSSATIPDGDKGDITVGSDGSLWLINTNAVDNVRLAFMPPHTYKGNNTDDPGNPKDVTPIELKTDIALERVDNTTDLEKPISTLTQEALNQKIDALLIGAANGVAPLDVTTKIPSVYLPAYVDDVLEFSNRAAFPATGVGGVIYIALDTNKTYRWGGSDYFEISPSPGSTDAVPEGAVNLYFQDARARAAVVIDSIVDGDVDHAPSRNAVFDAIAAINTSIGGVVIDSIADDDLTHAPSRNAVFDALALKADKAISITAGTGLTGGGSLAANRTLSIAPTGVQAGGFGSSNQSVVLTVNSQGQLTAVSQTFIQVQWSNGIQNKPTTLAGFGITDAVPDTRLITAGVGLSGGGALSTDRTISMGTPSTVSGISSNSVTGTTHSHAVTLRSDHTLAADLPSSYVLVNPSVGQVNSGTGFPGPFGTLLNAILDATGNRAFQFFSETKGGTSLPAIHVRSHHSTDGGGGWTAFAKLALDAGLVHIEGTETINGQKSFTLTPTVGANPVAIDVNVVHIEGAETINGAKIFKDLTVKQVGATTSLKISTDIGQIGDVTYYANDVLRWALRKTNSEDFQLKRYNTSGVLVDNTFTVEDVTGVWTFAVAAAPKVGTDIMWHAGNDGAGSGLDADTVDGIHAASLALASNFAEGVYTPTLTNITNATGSNAYPHQYMRIGNTVTVSGKIDADPTTAATSMEVRISLPTATANFANESNAGGAAVNSAGKAARLMAQVGGATVRLVTGTDIDDINRGWYYSFTYRIQ